MIAFTPASGEVEKLGPACIHNLSDDGKLWLAYPKGSSRRYKSDINRDHGWNTVTGAGFRPVRPGGDRRSWSALRFR